MSLEKCGECINLLIVQIIKQFKKQIHLSPIQSLILFQENYLQL
jgi:hypothetical protein